MKKMFNVELEKEELEKLDQLARKNDRTRKAQAAWIIKQYIKNENKKGN